MKNILLLAALLFSNTVFGQGITINASGSSANVVSVDAYTKTQSDAKYPLKVDTILVDGTTIDKTGHTIRVDTGKMATIPDLTIGLAAKAPQTAVDTLPGDNELTNKLALKLNKTDTTAMSNRIEAKADTTSQAFSGQVTTAALKVGESSAMRIDSIKVVGTHYELWYNGVKYNAVDDDTISLQLAINSLDSIYLDKTNNFKGVIHAINGSGVTGTNAIKGQSYYTGANTVTVYGVNGTANGTGANVTNIGIYGNAVNGLINYAGYFSGNVVGTADIQALSLTTAATDTTVTAVVGRIVFKTSNSHFYGCKATSGNKWHQLDN